MVLDKNKKGKSSRSMDLLLLPAGGLCLPVENLI
jgi:hypothetical protein